MAKRTFCDIDDYHRAFPEVRPALDRLRALIRAAAPGATEAISYNMPAFRQHGILVCYAAYNSHIGFYPTAGPIAHFASRLKGYKTSKGAVQFRINQPFPEQLIFDMVTFRLAEDRQRQAGKSNKTKI